MDDRTQRLEWKPKIVAPNVWRSELTQHALADAARPTPSRREATQTQKSSKSLCGWLWDEEGKRCSFVPQMFTPFAVSSK